MSIDHTLQLTTAVVQLATAVVALLTARSVLLTSKRSRGVSDVQGSSHTTPGGRDRKGCGHRAPSHSKPLIEERKQQ
jgi:hypothetical protein